MQMLANLFSIGKNGCDTRLAIWRPAAMCASDITLCTGMHTIVIAVTAYCSGGGLTRISSMVLPLRVVGTSMVAVRHSLVASSMRPWPTPGA